MEAIQAKQLKLTMKHRGFLKQTLTQGYGTKHLTLLICALVLAALYAKQL